MEDEAGVWGGGNPKFFEIWKAKSMCLDGKEKVCCLTVPRSLWGQLAKCPCQGPSLHWRKIQEGVLSVRVGVFYYVLTWETDLCLISNQTENAVLSTLIYCFPFQ